MIHAEQEFGDQADALNEATFKLVAEHPDRFVAVGTVTQKDMRVHSAISQLRGIATDGAIGVNLAPAFFGLELDSRVMYPVYAEAESLGLLVAVHTGINYVRSRPIAGEHPLKLDQVAIDFPDLTIVACHAGWPWVADLVAVARRHPTVYLEFGGMAPRYIGTPGSGWEVGYRFLDTLLQDQVLFGTDWPVFGIVEALSQWRSLTLKDATLERLLGGNASRLITRHHAASTTERNDRG